MARAFCKVESGGLAEEWSAADDANNVEESVGDAN